MTAPVGRPAAGAAEGVAPPRWWWAVAVASVAVAALHFALVAIWLVPVGGGAARAFAGRWVAPLFTQNWWLFAPDPPAVDRQVAVRGVAAAGDGAVTPWLPLTRRATAEVARNRLTARNARWLVLLNATYALTGPSGPLRLRGGARELVLRSWTEPKRQPAALVVLTRLGAVALREAYPERRFERLQVRITVRPLPPPAGGGRMPRPPADELRFPPVAFPREVAEGAAP